MTDCFTPEKRSWVMGRIPGKDTAPERLLRSMLHRRGYRFRVHRSDLPGQPDVVMPKYKALVYVHGCFWHGHDCKDGHRPKSNTDYWNRKLDRNMARDETNLEEARKRGWRPLVVWQCELTQQPDAALERVLRHIGGG